MTALDWMIFGFLSFGFLALVLPWLFSKVLDWLDSSMGDRK